MTPRTVLLHGQSLLLSGLAAGLEQCSDLRVARAATCEEASRLLAEGIPDVIIFDMTEPCERHVLPLLFKDPHLLMIGLDAERNRAVLVSGHEAHSLTLNQITEIVQTGAAALQ